MPPHIDHEPSALWTNHKHRKSDELLYLRLKDASGFSMGKTALFVIDIQNELADDPKTEIPRASEIRLAGTEILNRARAHIDQARDKGTDPNLHLIFVQHAESESEEGATLLKDSQAWGLVFKPKDEDDLERLVPKTTPDTFESNTELAKQLREDGIDKIVTFGIQSEHCVVSTSKGALAAGFDVTLLQGAHSTYDTEDRSARVIENDIDEELGSLGARLLPWEQWTPDIL